MSWANTCLEEDRAEEETDTLSGVGDHTQEFSSTSERFKCHEKLATSKNHSERKESQKKNRYTHNNLEMLKDVITADSAYQKNRQLPKAAGRQRSIEKMATSGKSTPGKSPGMDPCDVTMVIHGNGMVVEKCAVSSEDCPSHINMVVTRRRLSVYEQGPDANTNGSDEKHHHHQTSAQPLSPSCLKDVHKQAHS
ncbi:hypothetical protein WISP_112757 [Willisornis vidua]|uniref:Uncharacterized protein n=1 Tax=Willisornis vidua TaxID=1566151 RepID=A0ABQ9CW00_9PASS|nr:hypothetical protein WISP_112757 [Willisornis vidua]